MTKYSPQTEAERLLALSEKVGRVAESLAELALERDARERPGPGSDRDVMGETVDWLIRSRRERGRYVPATLFGEPSWDMMLHLLRAEIDGRRMPLSDVSLATDLPEAVGRRWLQAMVQSKMVALHAMPEGGEEQVGLAPDVSNGLRRYVRDIIGQS